MIIAAFSWEVAATIIAAMLMVGGGFITAMWSRGRKIELRGQNGERLLVAPEYVPGFSPACKEHSDRLNAHSDRLTELCQTSASNEAAIEGLQSMIKAHREEFRATEKRHCSKLDELKQKITAMDYFLRNGFDRNGFDDNG